MIVTERSSGREIEILEGDYLIIYPDPELSKETGSIIILLPDNFKLGGTVEWDAPAPNAQGFHVTNEFKEFAILKSTKH
jgi:hypothetical protein